MAIRINVDIPEPLHNRLRHAAEKGGISIRVLIMAALEQAYGEHGNKGKVTGPPVAGKGTPGPMFPSDENPHDLVFS